MKGGSDFFSSKMDTYVSASFLSINPRTKPFKTGSNKPEWNETLSLQPICDKEEEYVTILLMEENSKKSKEIGTA
jgi:hypothetical protein